MALANGALDAEFFCYALDGEGLGFRASGLPRQFRS